MKVMLLGATGLLGHNVFRRLLDDGHEVVALVRRRQALHLEAPDSMVVEVKDYGLASLVAHAQGCDAIVNCAGTTDMSLLHAADYRAANVDLPIDITRAMEAVGIKRLVHVSTVNTIATGSTASPADETAPAPDGLHTNLYAQSKLEGEQALLRFAHTNTGYHVVIINPGFMVGPLDAKPSSGRLLLATRGRRLMAAPRGGKSFVDARDVAASVTAALDRGDNGSRYIATNPQADLTFKQLFELQAHTMGYRQRVVELPDWLLRCAGVVGDALRAMGVRTELSGRNIAMMLVREHYDNHHATSQLQMPQTPLEQSIRDFHAWRNTQKSTHNNP